MKRRDFFQSIFAAGAVAAVAPAIAETAPNRDVIQDQYRTGTVSIREWVIDLGTTSLDRARSIT